MKPILVLTSILISLTVTAQLGAEKTKFSKQDTLRGSITKERAWWNVLHYNITVEPDFDSKSIAGNVRLTFEVQSPGREMQIDLQEPMQLTAATYNNNKIPLKRNGNVYYASFPSDLKKGKHTILLEFSGKPKQAVNPPWDGGWIWKKDAQGRPWMSVACQGLGASVWFPCKDHQSDEPDLGADLNITIPDTLVAVGNGRLLRSSIKENKATYSWKVVNPINSYNIIPYIGKYTHFSDTLQSEKGILSMDYWVLDYNLEKAKKQFEQAKSTIHCFEHWMGAYPFFEDGFKLVESPHLGMEHQSAVAYGNQYKNGYLGRDLSGTGWGLKWDFIIVHETGHEWFGNNITTFDIADMWVHEGFTNYTETLYTEWLFGRDAGDDYNYGIRKNIQNDKPIIGPYLVNEEGSGDMYNKGSNMIHTLRNSLNDDEKFRHFLRLLNQLYYHKIVTSKEIENSFSKVWEFDLNKFFDQYLRTTQIPVLHIKKDADNKKITIYFSNCVEGFRLPISPKGHPLKRVINDQPQSFSMSQEEMNWWNKKNIERYYYFNVIEE